MSSNLSNLNNLFNDELYLKERRKKIWIGVVLVIIMIIIAGVSIALFLKPWNGNYIYSNDKNKNISGQVNLSDNSNNNDNYLNILILGIPGEGNDAPNLTDTILVASVKKNDISLISIPRDLLVEIPNQNRYAKINSLYAIAKNPEATLLKAEEITGFKIHKYLIVDLQVVKELINQVGGLNLLVEKNIYDTLYPDDKHSYQTFSLDKGWRYFDGARALRYIRSRQSTSDFDRMDRQQQVIGALKNKLSASVVSWDLNRTMAIYQTLASHIKTDLNIMAMWQLWQIAKKIPNEQISKIIIDREFLTDDQIILGGATAAVLVPKEGMENYEKIKQYIQK